MFKKLMLIAAVAIGGSFLVSGTASAGHPGCYGPGYGAGWGGGWGGGYYSQRPVVVPVPIGNYRTFSNPYVHPGFNPYRSSIGLGIGPAPIGFGYGSGYRGLGYGGFGGSGMSLFIGR
jgi:hypothetical protein